MRTRRRGEQSEKGRTQSAQSPRDASSESGRERRGPRRRTHLYPVRQEKRAHAFAFLGKFGRFQFSSPLRRAEAIFSSLRAVDTQGVTTVERNLRQCASHSAVADALTDGSMLADFTTALPSGPMAPLRASIRPTLLDALCIPAREVPASARFCFMSWTGS